MPQHVSMVLGIPCDGLEIIVHNYRSTPNRTYKLKVVETNLRTLPVGEEFCNSSLIFSCTTILASNSKQEGIQDLWDSILVSDCIVKRNYANFVLQYLEDDIHEFQRSNSSHLRRCIIFLQLFFLSYTTISSVPVELTHLLCASLIDQLIKRCLSEERKYFRRYGCVDIRIEQCHASQNISSRPSYPSTSMYMPSHPSTYSHNSDLAKVLILRVIFQ